MNEYKWPYESSDEDDEIYDDTDEMTESERSYWIVESVCYTFNLSITIFIINLNNTCSVF